MHGFEDAFFLPLLGFSAFLGTNILRGKKNSVGSQKLSVPSIQYCKTNTDAFTTPQRWRALTSTERISLNFYWKAVCWPWLKKNADWSLGSNNPSGTAVKTKKWQSRKHRNSPFRSTYWPLLSKSVLKMEIFLTVHHCICNRNTLWDIFIFPPAFRTTTH